jgi:murein DD-endopeptidase MepM/ murein hydrolase activator NlpD
MSYKGIKDKISRKLSKESVKGFFQKQGLYVLIFLCVVAAGITAIVAWPRDEGDQISDSDQGAAAIEAPMLSDELARATPVPTVSALPSASPSASAQPSASGQANPNGSGKMTLTKPLKGLVINKFSGDSLVSFASLGIWMTHNGVDIKAEKGASVGAALSGTVSEVTTDDSNGGMVVIAHSGNAMTVYAGLGNIVVKKDEKVNAGQKIGEIGEMPKELDLSYHLHFEYMVDGEYEDPENYFK